MPRLKGKIRRLKIRRLVGALSVMCEKTIFNAHIYPTLRHKKTGHKAGIFIFQSSNLQSSNLQSFNLQSSQVAQVFPLPASLTGMHPLYEPGTATYCSTCDAPASDVKNPSIVSSFVVRINGRFGAG